MKRDSQRAKVYKWQMTIDNPDKGLTFAACCEIVNEVCRHYNVRPPRVVRGRNAKRDRATYDPWNHLISLPPWAYSRRTVLHETAHALTPHDHHGPVFMRVYIDLLVKFNGCDRKTITASARAAKLKIAPSTKAPSLIKPRALNRMDVIRARLKEIEAERSALQSELRALTPKMLVAASIM